MTGPMVTPDRETLARWFRWRRNGIYAAEIDAQHEAQGIDPMICKDSICARSVDDADALLPLLRTTAADAVRAWAEDEALVEAVAGKAFPDWHGPHGRVSTRDVLHALAAALGGES